MTLYFTSRYVSSVALPMLMLCCLMMSCDVANARSERIRKCGNEATSFLKWFCQNPTFEFPFDFSKVHVVLRYQPPRKELYPFQYQAAVCCKMGCKEYEFRRLCRYQNLHDLCTNGINIRTKEGRDARAQCLLQVHGLAAAPKTIAYSGK
ncbi:uncharacterized protein LOC120341590 isoform X2 [Styela clava]